MSKDDKRQQMALESIAVSLNSVATTLETLVEMLNVALTQAAQAQTPGWTPPAGKDK
jgi:hypothetical protein